MINMIKVFPKAKINKKVYIILSSRPSAKPEYGPFKCSAHVVIREHGYYSCGKAVEKALCDKLDAIMKFKCDRSVYKEEGKAQKMRMLLCYKRIEERSTSPEDDPNRVLQLLGFQSVDVETYKRTIIQNVAVEEHIHVQLEEVKPTNVTLKQIMQDIKEEDAEIKSGFIEYTDQTDDERMDSMNALFDS